MVYEVSGIGAAPLAPRTSRTDRVEDIDPSPVPASQRGAIVVEHLLVSILLLALVMGLIQLALSLHVRNILIDAAGEGARHAALFGNDSTAARQRTAEVIESVLPGSYASDITVDVIPQSGMEIMTVRVRAPLPLVGYFGPTVVEVTGRAVAER